MLILRYFVLSTLLITSLLRTRSGKSLPILDRGQSQVACHHLSIMRRGHRLNWILAIDTENRNFACLCLTFFLCVHFVLSGLVRISSH